MARGQHAARNRRKLPRQLVGKDVQVAELFVKANKPLGRLLIRGDRGVLDLRLTHEELDGLLVETPTDGQPDVLRFTFTLVPGNLARLRQQFTQAVHPVETPT